MYLLSLRFVVVQIGLSFGGCSSFHENILVLCMPFLQFKSKFRVDYFFWGGGGNVWRVDFLCLQVNACGFC